MIPVLKGSHYKAALEPVEGGAHFSHMARVDFEGHLATAYVKAYPPGTGGIVGEALGHIAAARHDIPRPQHAAILELHPLQLSGMGAPEWIRKSKVPILAWCCERLPGKSLEHWYKTQGNHDELWGQVLKSEFAAPIVSIDELIANCDRNSGNLIRLSARAWAVIDHGEALGTHLWPNIGGPQDFGVSELLKRADATLSDDKRKMFASSLMSLLPVNQTLVGELQPFLDQLFILLGLSGSGAAVIPFLAQRVDPRWLQQRIGMLI